MGGRPRVAQRAFLCTLDDCRLGALNCSYVIYGVSMWEGGGVAAGTPARREIANRQQPRVKPRAFATFAGKVANEAKV